jgi:hypothetical protein
MRSENASLSYTVARKIMTNPNWILVAALSLSLISCNRDKTVDGKNDETFKKSLEEMKDSLPIEKREDFERAVMATGLEGTNLLEAAADADGMKRRMLDRLDGKTVSEILARAEEIESDRREQQNVQIMKEIEELEKKANDAEKAAAKLDAFRIEKSRFYFDDSGFSTKPIIELTVTNNTESAIARAYFHGVLATPGRSIPWVEDDFNYSISGGLEPGESAVWSLAPNMFGNWAKAPKDRNDMVFTAKVTRIDGADGEALLDAQFSDYDRKRLEHLRATLRN